ncbi:MAG: ABC transporter ATP-binding protein [Lentisphaerae bacterium]|nr:ABC transporter ATP-binding protein [Lentisphaerota bacterium]
MSDVLVSFDHVSKKFCRSLKRSLWYGVRDVAHEIFGGGNRERELRAGEFWAVKDVSFELKRGECMGLIGRNGAGKTTLLRMLNGLIKPDRGRITMRGRIGALIALGAGFNPILTGRENIYVNGSVLGLTKHEIDGKLDEIIDFAEIGEFIDTPVQNYSSGMQVRLGFAVASSLKPDILIADEVLAVGDATFRSKCYRRLAELQTRGISIILVSHQMPDLQRVCTKCIWLLGGSVAQNGEMAKVVSDYLVWSDTQSKIEDRGGYESTQPKLSGARIVEVHTLTQDGRPSSEFKTGDGLRVRLEYEVSPHIRCLNFSLSFNSGVEALYHCYATKHDDFSVCPSSTRGYVDLVFPSLCLGSGTYWISAAIADEAYIGIYDWNWQAKLLVIKNDKPMLGRFSFPHFWQGSGIVETVHTLLGCEKVLGTNTSEYVNDQQKQ